MTKNVYLVELLHDDGNYHSTPRITFTSKQAAMKYAVNCGFKTNIVKVCLITLNDF